MQLKGWFRALAFTSFVVMAVAPQAHSQPNTVNRASRNFAATAMVVGTGTAASCTPASLAAALADAAQSSGTVTFNCGIAPVSILTSDAFTVDAGEAVTVDGSGLITLDASEGHRFFSVQPEGALTLRNINLIRGRSDGGGAIFNAGSLTLDGVRITQSFAVGAGAGGGAIGNAGGVVVIQNSTLAANGAESIGGAISSQGGSLTIENSTFEGNQADTFGALDIASDATLSNLTVRGNTATSGCGGGIGVQTGLVTIADSLFVTNTSASCGGGVYISPNFTATVTLRDSRIVQNRADPLFNGSLGGGIFNGGALTVTRVTVDGNAAYSAGGLWQYGTAAPLVIEDSTFKHNTAAWAGGAMQLSGGQGHTLTNVTISSNSAGNWGGGIGALDYPTTLRNVTLSGNAAPSGANVYAVRTTVTLANSIVNAPSGGDNCGAEQTATPFTSNGYNVSSDGSCTVASAGDQSSVDPLLGALADNEQGMLTHLPQAGSPAIDSIPPANCPDHDQRGYGRPAGGACDAGALEVGAVAPEAPALPPLVTPINLSVVRPQELRPIPLKYPFQRVFVPGDIAPIDYLQNRHPIDLSICMYRGDLDGAGSEKRARYETLLKYFADAVYEMSNGAHIVRYITINYPCNWPSAGANDHVIWQKKLWPQTTLSGYGVPGQHIMMADIFAFDLDGGQPFTATQSGDRGRNGVGTSDFYLRSGGYTLAHELGHYLYGIADEYAKADEDCDTDNPYHGPCKDDLAVSPSVMSNQFEAPDSFGGSRYQWLNHSTSKLQTKKNRQYRLYQADGWTTLARPASKDPQEIYKPRRFKLGVINEVADTMPAALPRYFFPELAKVAPKGNDSPSIELPSDFNALRDWISRRLLTVIWQRAGEPAGDPPVSLRPIETPFHRCLACPENILRENKFAYPNPVEFNLQLKREWPVAGAQVFAEVTAPDNSTKQVPALDDGAGNYRVQVPYAMGGQYQVKFSFLNTGGKAIFTSAGAAHTPGPDGSSPPEVSEPVGVPFTVTVSTVFTVAGFQADDHGDTLATATALTTNDEPVMGRIDRAADADAFTVAVTQTGVLAVRVLDLTEGMRPRLLVTRNGVTVADVTYDPAASPYLLARVSAKAGEVVGVVLTDAGGAAGAHYQISAGAPLDSLTETPRPAYLPLVLR
jgi:hypothetical protein